MVPWHRWRDLNIDKPDLDDVKNECGIYMIRAVKKISEDPIPIQRCGGKDGDGCLYIGRSVDIHRRLLEFCRSARKNEKGHPGGYTYSDGKYKDRLHPEHKLQFSVYYCKKNEIKDKEKYELHYYAYNSNNSNTKKNKLAYLDLPPLNSQAGF